MKNQAQEKAANFIGHLVISAGPGSGKTTTMIQRAVRIVSAPGNRRKVAMVTFTNQAAKDLGRRLDEKHPELRHLIDAETFHKICDIHLGPYGGRPPRVTDSLKFAIIECLRNAEQASLNGESTQQTILAVDAVLAAYPGGIDSPLGVHERLTAGYEDQLKIHKKRDMQDDLRADVHGMRMGTIEPLNVTHLLVDEFQDADELQLAWVLCHVDAGIEVTVCGDDDQSLYKFRRALGYEAMRRFADHAHAAHLVLDTTFRCPALHMKHASSLIAFNNPNRIEKHLVSASSESGYIRAFAFTSERHEAEAIVQHLSKHGQNYANFAVLSRNRRALDGVANALAEAGIPSEIVGETSFWDVPAVAKFIEALAYTLDLEPSGLAILLYHAGLERREVNAVLHRIHRHGGGVRAFCTRLSEADGEAVCALKETLRAALNAIDQGDIATASEALIAYFMAYAPQFMAERMREAAITGVARLSEKMSMAGAVRLLRKKHSAEEPKPLAPVVCLSTLHGAKGLEWDEAWIIRCEERELPSATGDLEEERRLCYVGITRGRKAVFLSYTTDRRRVRSRFIDEAEIPISVGVPKTSTYAA